MAYPGAPATWGTWTEDTYFGFSPRQISASSDPDGRLRAAFINARPIADAGTRRQALMLSYRRGAANFREQEIVTLKHGLPAGTAYSTNTEEDFVTNEASLKPLRTKIRSADRAGTGFEVRTRLIRDYSQAPSGLTLSYLGRFLEAPPTNPYFPRRPWTGRDSGRDTVQGFGVVRSVADSLGVGAGGAVIAATFAVDGNGFYPTLSPVYFTGNSSLSAPISGFMDDATVNGGRVFAMDSALTDDGSDGYHLISSAVLTSSQGIRSQLRLVRQRTSPTANNQRVTTAALPNVFSPGSAANSMIQHPQVLLTRATGEPKWIVWSDTYNAEIRVAKRNVALPDVAGSDDTNLNRRINGGYTVLPVIDTFAFGCDAALDRLDRLHLVWWTPVGGLVHYARENSSGGFDEITLPTPAGGAPALAVGPGEYPYILYPGAATASPNETAPLIIATPPGLQAAYHGDFEDRDRDGRPALLERAMGSSDAVVETGVALRAVTLTATLATVSPGVRRFETGFQLTFNATRVLNTTVWNLADGNDTIRIQPTYSVNGMTSFNSGGFSLTDEFTINGQVRYVTVRDTASVTTFPRQFYRLQVTRLPGAP